MTEADEARAPVRPPRSPDDAKLAEYLERRRELVVFRDAGVLSDGELEEQLVKLRWELS